MKTPSSFAALRCCSLGVLGLAFAVSAFAQSPAAAPKNRMLTVSYMKTVPGRTADYLKGTELWKQVHQDLVNKGRLTSWRLYVVSWPNGDDQEYDYVTMMEYPSFADMESLYVASEMTTVLGEAKYKELQATTPAVRTLRRSDTLIILHATEGWSKASNQVLNVHYLRSLPGKASDLMKSQREYFLPANEELVKAGNATSWAATSVRYPVQFDHPYNYVSFNGYESLSQLEKEAPQVWREKWSGARSTENSALLAASRKRVKGQLWRLVDQTTPRQLTTSL